MLSVIIPTLNEEKFLPRLLESIKKQNFPDLEIVVADAGSQDKTIILAESFGCRIAAGGEPGRGRNNGAKIAKNDLLLFLDADCLLAEGFLDKILKEFAERKLDLATCLIMPFGQSKGARLYYRLFFNLFSRLLEKVYPNGTGLFLVKKEIHQKIGGFAEDIKIGEDHEYLRRGARRGRYGVLKSAKFYFSQRRFEREGWFKMFFKYLLIIVHALFLGPVKTDVFKYKFNQRQ